MKSYNLSKMQKKLKKDLDEDRYRHTMGVMYTSAALAMRYGADLMKAQTAGLLHDCAKCIPNDKKLRLCEKYMLPVSDVEKKAPFLLHAKLGAYLASAMYDVDDPEILSAIEWHTTGKPDMTLLEKIVFLADYIEPMRFKAPKLAEIRRMAFIDLDMAVYMTLRDTLLYLQNGSAQLDDMTVRAYEFYRRKLEMREEILSSDPEVEAEREEFRKELAGESPKLRDDSPASSEHSSEHQ